VHIQVAADIARVYATILVLKNRRAGDHAQILEHGQARDQSHGERRQPSTCAAARGRKTRTRWSVSIGCGSRSKGAISRWVESRQPIDDGRHWRIRRELRRSRRLPTLTVRLIARLAVFQD